MSIVSVSFRFFCLLPPCHVVMLAFILFLFASFVRPLADVPNILKCSCDEPRMRLGEPLVSDIILSVTDKHGNKTGKVRWIYASNLCLQRKEIFAVIHQLKGP